MASPTASHGPFNLKRMSKTITIPYHIDIHSCGGKRTFILNHCMKKALRLPIITSNCARENEG